MRAGGPAAPPPPPEDRPFGLIVAGGKARRLGGGDKSLRVLGDRTILAWLIERLAPQCTALGLSANGDPGRFAGYRLPVIADHPEDAEGGPLAGVLAGLDWIAQHQPATSLMLSMPADCPLPPPDLASALGAALGREGTSMAAARSDGRRHPLAALWPVAGREALRGALRRDGEVRVGAFADRLGCAWVDWPTTPFDPFTNVNTPDDLAAAAKLVDALLP